MKLRKLLDNVLSLLSDRRYLTTAGVVIIAYVLAARLGLSLSYQVEQVTTVWPPSGIALVALLVLGYRYWPAVLVGAFTANALVNEPLWVAFGIAIGNTLEALAGAYLLKRVFKFANAFVVPRDVLVFAAAAAASTVIAAVMGPLWLAWGGLIEWSEYSQVASTWWLGDVLGDLLFGPFLLTAVNIKSARQILRGRYLEGGLVLAITFAATIGVFATKTGGALALPYIMFPLVTWAAVRFTQLGVVSAVMMIAITSIWCSIGGLGPFVRTTDNMQDALVQLQLYLVVISATSLVVAMVITERLSAETRLRRQREELRRLEGELKEANQRVTNILEDVLEGNGKRNGHA